MACSVTFAEKRPVFACGEGLVVCHYCSDVAEALCDYPIGNGQTCDLPLCSRHRVRRGPEWYDIDLCPFHSVLE